MGADLYIKLKYNGGAGAFERSESAVERGYFRDPYNDWSVLWLYGLSWWTDIGKLQDKETGNISVANTKKFLKMLDGNEKTFKVKLAEKPTDAQPDYIEGRKLLRKFLEEAIKAKSPIEASL